MRHFCFESELSVFLFFLHLRCSNVYSLQPFDCATALPKPPP